MLQNGQKRLSQATLALALVTIVAIVTALIACSLFHKDEEVGLTITFYAKEGFFVTAPDAPTASSTINRGRAISPPKILPPAPSKSDKAFVLEGWSISSRNTPERPLYDLSEGANYDMDLYAVWSEVDGPVKNDWLFLMYMDADNNLEEMLKADVNEMEAGLFQMSDTASVTVAVLWDGRGKKDSYLYELGPDTNPTQLGHFTTDVSDTASWLESGEVDMSSPVTLANFIIWAKNRYSTKNVALLFSDHGGGPRSGGDGPDLAMLVDDTTGKKSIMYSREASAALREALVNSEGGYWNHFNLVLYDLCLGASLEDAFEMCEFADFMVASPGNIPGNGFDYTWIFERITANTTPETLGASMVTGYAETYGAALGNALTCINLTRIPFLAHTFENFASFIFTEGTKKIFPTLNSSNGGTLSTNYQIALGQVLQDVIMYYNGSYTRLYDLGAFCERIRSYCGPTLNGAANPYSWPTLYQAAQAVEQGLNNAILYSWSNGGLSQRSFEGYIGTDSIHGITICGEPSGTTGADNYPGWYRTDLAFGAQTSWGSLLEIWYTQLWK
jgi:hypothetical protein